MSVEENVTDFRFRKPLSPFDKAWRSANEQANITSFAPPWAIYANNMAMLKGWKISKYINEYKRLNTLVNEDFNQSFGNKTLYGLGLIGSSTTNMNFFKLYDPRLFLSQTEFQLSILGEKGYRFMAKSIGISIPKTKEIHKKLINMIDKKTIDALRNLVKYSQNFDLAS